MLYFTGFIVHPISRPSWPTGQLLRHYSPDLEVFRVLVNSININIKSVVGARITGVASDMGNVGDPVNLAEMAR